MEEKRSAAFGSYLKTVRLEKGIELSTISDQTRISKDTLAALEDEDHSRLPAEVFVKGFIRAYARVVGADGDVAIKGFSESCRQRGDIAPPRTDLTGGPEPARGRGLLLLGILVLIAIAGIWAWRAMSALTSTEQIVAPLPAEPPAASQAAPEETQPPAAPVPSSEAQPSEQAAVQSRQRIRIQVIEDTWIKVITDSLTTTEYSLGPGDTLELEADIGFNLLIGNATGIQLTYNGEPVTVPGKSGQVVTLQLP